jgi:hypothetical protein
MIPQDAGELDHLEALTLRLCFSVAKRGERLRRVPPDICRWVIEPTFVKCGEGSLADLRASG